MTMSAQPVTEALAGYGFRFPRRQLAQSATEAVREAERIGFPVVLKVASDDIPHRTELGGVRTGLRSASDVTAAFAAISESVRRHELDAVVDGLWVEEMCTEGTEVFLGVQHNPIFGLSILFGLGGTFSELLEDVAFRVLPIDEADAYAMIDALKGRAVLEGFRGLPPVDQEMLVQLLLRLGRFAMDRGATLEALDLNPVMVWGREHRVLDAKLTELPAPRDLSVEPPNTEHLDAFFEPGAVAVIGASDDRSKIGSAILESLRRGGYNRPIYPINPKRPQVQGLPAYPSVTAAPGPVDLAVAAVPLPALPSVLDDCGQHGTRSVIIVSGGGKELGEAGRVVEHEIRDRAAAHGIRIIGPNCIGVFDGRTRCDTFFQLDDRMQRPPSGPAAVLTQSGTVGAWFLERASFLGVSKFVSYGNRLDVDEADLLAYLSDDDETRAIACYIEGLDDGRKFLRTVRAVTRTKPVVVFKAGRTSLAAHAAVSHTGFFGGTSAAWEGALQQAGTILVDSFEALYAATDALCRLPWGCGPRAAMLSNGAGPMVQALDLFPQHGLMLGILSEDTKETLRGDYPPFFVVDNPIDVTGSGTARDYLVGIRACLEDPGIDIVMPWFVFQDPALGSEIVEGVAKLQSKASKPIVCGTLGGSSTRSLSEALERAGVPVYGSVAEWVTAASALRTAADTIEGGGCVSR